MSHQTHTASALIIIDVQQSFAQMPFWTLGDVPAFQSALLRLEAGCRARGVPVVHIFHVGKGGPFTQESGFVKPLPWLAGAPDVRFQKHTHNAFTDTGLMELAKHYLAAFRQDLQCLPYFANPKK